MTPEELTEYLKAYSKEPGEFNEKDILKFILQIKSEWCKEQRVNCAKIISRNTYEMTIKENKERILNAPEP